MKKKILALVCAMTMVIGTGMSVSAASSATASATASEVANQASSSESSDSSTELFSAGENATGQVLTTATLSYFAETTTVSGVQGAVLAEVSADTAKAMIARAKTIAGKNTFIASIVDLQVPAGTGTATFTLSCPIVWKGQNVTILHQKSDGSFENITPSSVEDNKVTFTMSSYSPIAIVINTGATSPKTGEIVVLVVAMATVFGIGAAVFGKKAREN